MAMVTVRTLASLLVTSPGPPSALMLQFLATWNGGKRAVDLEPRLRSVISSLRYLNRYLEAQSSYHPLSNCSDKPTVARTTLLRACGL